MKDQQGMPKERDISVADVKKIRDAEIKEKSQRVARDVFMLSYYLGGINLMDLMQYNFKDAKIMEYVREKSKNTKKGDMKISFTIPEEAKPIIKRWMGRNGKLDFGYKYSYPNFRNYVTKRNYKVRGEAGGRIACRILFSPEILCPTWF